MGFIQALSAHLHAYAWAYPNDLLPHGIQPAAAQTLYNIAAELQQAPEQAGGAHAEGALPAPFSCLLSMLASDNAWAVGMGQSWLLQLLLLHAEAVIAGEALLSQAWQSIREIVQPWLDQLLLPSTEVVIA